MSKRMTPRQAQVLKIVSEFWSEQGYAPSMREIAIKMEPPLKSVNSVRDIVVRLCEKNILKKRLRSQYVKNQMDAGQDRKRALNDWDYLIKKLKSK